MNQHLRSLLEQIHKHNGRGNMIAVNETMVEVIETLAAMIDQSCRCNCGRPSALPRDEPPIDIGLAPEGIEDPSLMMELPVKRKVGRPRKITTEPRVG